MKTLFRLDTALFAVLTLLLLGIVVISGMANLQTDSIDYYALVQRLVGDAPPILSNLPFLTQRSPGYPLLALPLYYALGAAAPLTEEQPAPRPIRDSSQGGEPPTSEAALLPPTPLKARDIFFKDFNLQPMGGVVRWQILAAMLLTGYALFFGGLLVSARTLTMLYPALPGRSLMPLTVLTSTVFMHNLVQTPAYATLTAFGVACLATYAWVLAWDTDLTWTQAASGVAMGMLVLVRLEMVVVAAVLVAGLLLMRRWRFLGWFAAGGLIPLALLLAYNTAQFGNPFHADILRGNMNILTLETAYVFAGLLGTSSGVVWYSALIALGVAGLLVCREVRLRILGWGALALVTLILLRVPVMYFCVGQGAQTVEGVAIACPPDWEALLQLVRLDVNRYVIPLAPFAVLGLRGLFAKVAMLRGIS